MLNEKQQQAFDIAKAGHSLTVLGSAGTGKSHVLSEIFMFLRQQGKQVRLTCSTGIAGTVYPSEFNVSTLHQFAGLEDGRHDPTEIASVLRSNPRYKEIMNNIMSTDILIVDECSMISARTFESLKAVCEMKNDEHPFGGMQLIFCGDFHQLPPVANPRYNDEGLYCFQSPCFLSVFPHRVVLDQNIRQTEELFVSVIKELNEGKLSECGKQFIDSVKRPLPADCDSVKLYSTNALVDEHNRKRLLESDGEMYEFVAKDTGEVDALRRLTAPKTLWLKLGCPVILLRNLRDGLVNGSRGTVVGITENEVTVTFPNLTTTIKKETFDVFDPKRNRNIATREQIPLKPAYALSIHKAQGMTLTWVEVDCREIFKTGQLVVAMSRARTSEGLRVNNFHPRCIFRPAPAVEEFIQGISKNLLDDLSCCVCSRKEVQQQHGAAEPRTQYTYSSVTDFQNTSEEELEDDFNEVMAEINMCENDTLEFDLPDNFRIQDLLKAISFSEEHTAAQEEINEIISKLCPENITLFVKRIFFKFSKLASNLKINADSPNAVPENALARFLQEVHNFTTGIDYIMYCLDLLAQSSFYDEHKIVCYRITEYIRQFVVEQKVSLLQYSSESMTRRFITDASRSRIRYVAGYCVSSLRKKYSHVKQSKMFGHSRDDQDAFENAALALKLINVLKEEEHFLRETTTDMGSLIDTERRQNARRGLTNVSDSVFDFYLKLTNQCLSQLTHKSMMKHGQSLFNCCLEVIKSDTSLYDRFCRLLIEGLPSEPLEYIGASEELPDITETMVDTVTKMHDIYNEMLEKYLMVFFAQFCRDYKVSVRIEKTMAHRKQIKVAKGGSSKRGLTSARGQKAAVPQPKTDKASKRRKKSEAGSEPLVAEPAVAFSSGQSAEAGSEPLVAEPVVASSSRQSAEAGSEPLVPESVVASSSRQSAEAGSEPLVAEPVVASSSRQSAEAMSELAVDTATDELCKKCQKSSGTQWIQCDSCESWLHRNCSGLRSAKAWKKYSKSGARWYCKDCE